MANPRGILLDIEGTTSSISFVHDVMFPFVLERLDAFLHEHADRADVLQTCEQIARDAGFDSMAAWQQHFPERSARALVQTDVRQLMAADVKATGLKALQGLIWQQGFDSGVLQSHVYPDVIPAIKHWWTVGCDVRIYSSGSIAAQKLFFGHVAELGDCLHLFSGHYDTTSGSKKESQSYLTIAGDWGLPPDEILFISDIAGELQAAQAAGVRVLASVRPGNAPLPPELEIDCIRSFDEVVLV